MLLMYHGSNHFGGGTAVKQLAIFSIALALSLAQGCTSNDKDKAGTERSITTPASASVAPASGGVAPISQPSDPAANGGSALPAAAPYSEANGASAPQNVNPAPFLVANESAGPGGATSAPASTLTSRADGTMSGPRDLPAATTGWGTPAAASEKPAATLKSKQQTAHPAAPK
jgi:hypothetical protein